MQIALVTSPPFRPYLNGHGHFPDLNRCRNSVFYERKIPNKIQFTANDGFPRSFLFQ